MPEMLLQEPLPNTYQIDEYDLTFTNGIALPVSINRELGDTIDMEAAPTMIKVYLAEKPSPVDPTKRLVAEDLLIYTKHILTIQHRTRTIRELTTEQKFEFLNALQGINNTVQ